VRKKLIKNSQPLWKKMKLEIWGRAQHEAARRLKSDWKYNLWG